MSLPAVDGYDVRRLSAADAGDLQALYERCSDYHEQHEGVPTPPDAAEEELAARPPGFDEIRRQPYTSSSGRESRLIVMRQTVG